MQKRVTENVPRTLDNTREHDPSMVSSPSVQIEELNANLASDPFAAYFNFTDDPHTPPKVLITTSSKASKATYEFCDELVGVFPGAEYVRRKKGKGFEVGRIAGWAAGRGYKHLVVVNEDMKKPSRCSTRPQPRALTDFLRCHHTGPSAQRTDGLLQTHIRGAHKEDICELYSMLL